MVTADEYEMVDWSKLEPLPHSQLYHLEPIGVGTPFVECLTSYAFQRLPEAHSVRALDLIREVYLPSIAREYPTEGGRTIQMPQFSHIYALNGTGKSAQRWVAALSKLTLQPKLHMLNLRPWHQVLSTRGLLRTEQAWCPMCFHAWREADLPIYIPLLWNLQIVAVCPLHRCFLQEYCHYCGTRLLVGNRGNLAGFCSCNRWLGLSKDDVAPEQFVPDEEWIIEHKVAEQVGELLAFKPILAEEPTRQNLFDAIRLWVDRSAGGNLADVGKQMDMSVETVAGWHLGRSLPSPRSLLLVSNSIGITLLELVLGKFLKSCPANLQSSAKSKRDRRNLENLSADFAELLRVEPPMSLNAIATSLESRSFFLKRKFPDFCHVAADRSKAYAANKRKEVQIVLEAALHEFPPPSLRLVTQRLGSTLELTRKRYPDHHRKIVARWQDYRTQQTQARRQPICEAIRAAILQLHNNGIRPSRDRVSQIVGIPALFRQEFARNVHRQAMQELGYDIGDHDVERTGNRK